MTEPKFICNRNVIHLRFPIQIRFEKPHIHDSKVERRETNVDINWFRKRKQKDFEGKKLQVTILIQGIVYGHETDFFSRIFLPSSLRYMLKVYLILRLFISSSPLDNLLNLISRMARYKITLINKAIEFPKVIILAMFSSWRYLMLLGK